MDDINHDVFHNKKHKTALPNKKLNNPLYLGKDNLKEL